MATPAQVAAAWYAIGDNKEWKAKYAYIRRILNGQMKGAATQDQMTRFGITRNADGSYQLPQHTKRSTPKVIVQATMIPTVVAELPQVFVPPAVHVNEAVDPGVDALVTSAVITEVGSHLPISPVTFKQKWAPSAVKNILVAGGADAATYNSGTFDVVEFLNRDPAAIIEKIKKKYPNVNSRMGAIQCITTWIQKVQPLSSRLLPETMQAFNKHRDDLKIDVADAQEEGLKNKPVVSWPGIMSLLKGSEQPVLWLYAKTFQVIPARKDLERVEIVTEAPANPQKNYAILGKNIKIGMVQYKSSKLYGARDYTLDEELSKGLVDDIKKTGRRVLFSQGTVRLVGDAIRASGTPFPFGDTHKRMDDVSGLRHALVVYQNSNANKGTDRGAKLAQRMMHSAATAKISYSNKKTIAVKGFTKLGRARPAPVPVPAPVPAPRLVIPPALAPPTPPPRVRPVLVQEPVVMFDNALFDEKRRPKKKARAAVLDTNMNPLYEYLPPEKKRAASPVDENRKKKRSGRSH